MQKVFDMGPDNHTLFPLVSVVVPIFKVQAYLTTCIESIINQSYQHIEVILVDDGSPDACPTICDEYARKDERIRVIHKENGGLVSGRKAGLLASHGDYVSYVDGDDWIESDFVETLVMQAISTDSEVTIAGFSKDLGDSSSRYFNLIPSGYYDRERIENEVLSKLIFCEEYDCPGVFSYVWNKLFRRKDLIPFQMSVPNTVFLGEDAACVYPLIAKANSISVINNCSYHYQQRPDSMLKTKGKEDSNLDRSNTRKVDASALKVLYDYLKKTYLFRYPLTEDVIKISRKGTINSLVSILSMLASGSDKRHDPQVIPCSIVCPEAS